MHVLALARTLASRTCACHSPAPARVRPPPHHRAPLDHTTLKCTIAVHCMSAVVTCHHVRHCLLRRGGWGGNGGGVRGSDAGQGGCEGGAWRLARFMPGMLRCDDCSYPLPRLLLCCLLLSSVVLRAGAQLKCIGCCVPTPAMFSISNLLRVACFLFSVCLEPFY